MTEFDKIIDRKGTFCTQWDFVEDRFGQKDLLPLLSRTLISPFQRR